MSRAGAPAQARPTGWLLGLAYLLPGLAWAQSAPSPLPVMDAASLPAGISERLRREAERPMYWIKVHGDNDKAEARKPAPARLEPVKPEAPRPDPVRAEAAKAEVAKPVPPARPVPVALSPVATAPVTPPPDVPRPLTPTADGSAPAPALASGPAAADRADAQAAAPATLLASVPASLPAPAVPPVRAPEPAPAAPQALAAEALELLSSVQPEFPQALMRRLRKGDLQVEVDVSTDGTVVDARVLSSSNPRLESAALTAIRTWQFKPPSRNTSAVINFSFDLDS
jgi:TonB family protein